MIERYLPDYRVLQICRRLLLDMFIGTSFLTKLGMCTKIGCDRILETVLN